MSIKENLPVNYVKSVDLEVQKGKKIIMVKHNENWEINITETAKMFNKRWRNWKNRNLKLIKNFEILEGRTLVREVGPKNRIHTYIDLVLGLRVLNDYDPVLSYHVFNFYKKYLLLKDEEIMIELDDYRKRVETAEAQLAELKNKPIDIYLEDGKFLLYAYGYNNEIKFGTSFCNRNGQRPKSHKTSVPNLAIGFVIYSSKKNLQDLNRAIKKRFKNRNEYLDCPMDELEDFVLEHIDIMDMDYQQKDIHILTSLNIYLKS